MTAQAIPLVVHIDHPVVVDGALRIVVLGGDGFCGWPTALHLSAAGHDVTIVDNFARRAAEVELCAESLTPIEPLATRGGVARGERPRDRRPRDRRRAGLRRAAELLADERPDAIVHFAEQRAAPYSMKSSRHKRYTVDNNVNATHNLLAALVEGLSLSPTSPRPPGRWACTATGPRARTIPEGYLRVRMDADDGTEVEQEILFLANLSVYHLTKTQDQLLFAFYNRNDELRITDLHQASSGTQTRRPAATSAPSTASTTTATTERSSTASCRRRSATR